MLELLLPPVCAVCGRPGTVLCGVCIDSLPAPGVAVPPPGLDACTALVAYAGTGRDLVAGFKFRHRHAVAAPLGRAMAATVRGPVELVSWVPTSDGRRAARGFDQARVLARAVARTLGVPVVATLRRCPGPPQTGRSRDSRLAGPRFEIAPGDPPVGGRHVLLVDDVVTTGATLGAAASAVRSLGPRTVRAVVVARTP